MISFDTDHTFAISFFSSNGKVIKVLQELRENVRLTLFINKLFCTTAVSLRGQIITQ